jgi:hypothetical protein
MSFKRLAIWKYCPKSVKLPLTRFWQDDI